MKDSKTSYFNLLKFIGAIFIACFLHYNDHLIVQINSVNSFREGSFIRYISTDSYVFVEMFFLISGILFGLVYIDRIIKGEKLLDFMKKRCLRIYPLVILSTIFMYVSNYFYVRKFASFFSCGGLNLSNLFLDLFSLRSIFDTTTPINGPLWYISSLIICYLFGYYIVKKYKNNTYIFLIPIIIGLFIIYKNVNFFVFNSNIARGLISFFTGVILYKFVLENIKNYSKRKVLLSKLFCLVIISLFVICAFNLNRNLYFDGYFNEAIAYTFFFFAPLLYILYSVGVVERICSSKIVIFLGNISYGIYVWNFPILIVVSYIIKAKMISINTASIWFFIILIAIHIIVGTLSYYLIEKNIKKHFKSKKTNK